MHIFYKFVLNQITNSNMLQFKIIELSDKEIILSKLLDVRCRCSDFSFPNLYGWAPKFQTSYCIEDDALLIRGVDEENNLFYMMPMASNDLKKSLAALMNDAEENNAPFIMHGVTEKMWDFIEELFPDEFVYAKNRDAAEYLYDAQKLITLAGRKMQKKRNHVNRFKADYPTWQYHDIKDEEQMQKCRLMLKEWDDKEHQDHHKNFDYIATNRMLKNFFELDLKGGYLTVDDKIIAFTAGSQLTSDTFCVHIEKAFAEYNGAYSAINQEFAKHNMQQYKLINREEDLGIEGLRKAKMSYYPDILLEEGSVSKK